VGARLKQKGVTAKSDVRLGIAAEEIIKLADEINANVVAMSTHGRSGVSLGDLDWNLGSVAEKLVHAENAPLLLVRPS